MYAYVKRVDNKKLLKVEAKKIPKLDHPHDAKKNYKVTCADNSTPFDAKVLLVRNSLEELDEAIVVYGRPKSVPDKFSKSASDLSDLDSNKIKEKAKKPTKKSTNPSLIKKVADLKKQQHQTLEQSII
ncbi:hypothetical protein TKK_0009905 [Trichogramma kaykai]